MLMNNKNSVLEYILQLADNALIIGHRLSEWCGHAPILEQDIAMTNISLDHLGRARSLYQYAATKFNQLPLEERKNYFLSVALQNMVTSVKEIDEDDLTYLRDAWDFKNLLLLEKPNGDWATTVARSFFYDAFNFYFFTMLKNSADITLAAIAEKSLKEVTYHLKWSSEWIIRLGDGTEESHSRVQTAINDLWAFTGEMFIGNDTDKKMEDAGIAPNLVAIKERWNEKVTAIFTEATIIAPVETEKNKIVYQMGGKDGKHTEHIGFILTELQYMQRVYPNMEW